MRVSEIFKGLMLMEGVIAPFGLTAHTGFTRGYGNAAANAAARGPISQPPPTAEAVEIRLPAPCGCG